MALVYSQFHLITHDGKVLASPHKYGVSGWVLRRHFYTNLVGNGCALIVRRNVLEEFSGSDLALRSQGVEGCEDLLLPKAQFHRDRCARSARENPVEGATATAFARSDLDCSSGYQEGCR